MCISISSSSRYELHSLLGHPFVGYVLDDTVWVGSQGCAGVWDKRGGGWPQMMAEDGSKSTEVEIREGLDGELTEMCRW
jgi:hypothetical protein